MRITIKEIREKYQPTKKNEPINHQFSMWLSPYFTKLLYDCNQMYVNWAETNGLTIPKNITDTFETNNQKMLNVTEELVVDRNYQKEILKYLEGKECVHCEVIAQDLNISLDVIYPIIELMIKQNELIELQPDAVGLLK